MLKIIFILLASLNLYAIDVDENTSGLDLLSKSFIYVDELNTPSKYDILDKKFKPYEKDSISLGFVDMSALWIKFTLKNTQNAPITKLIEYDNQEVEDVYFYDAFRTIEDGMYHIKADRFSVNPIFETTLQAREERTYYIKAHSRISNLIGKVVIWEKNEFILNDQKHKLYIFIFFTIIITLLVYNVMIYAFTGDDAYLYYVIYLFGVIIFQAMYLGVAQLYFLSNAMTVEITKATFAYISVLVIPIILFTREFLNTPQFPRLDSVLKLYLYVSPIIIILSYDNILFNLNIIAIFIPLGLTIVFTAAYALYNGEKQAKFYIAGWTFIIVSLLVSILKSLGLIEVTKYFYYVNEVAFVLEAFLFSIALAHRIKLLAQEKNDINQKLINFQRSEQNRLRNLVSDKTVELRKSLLEKDILYKELNHRVKNNLQMILSLLNLQISKARLKTKDELSVTKNRVNSISILYDKLNSEQGDATFSTREYCEHIVESMKQNFSQKVNIICDVTHELEVSKLVYFGLILNELLTNAMKYAFEKSIVKYILKNSDDIRIDLYKKDNTVYLIVQDNGVGFIEGRSDSLGLEIVKTLATKQLLGDMLIESQNGTKITITWEEK